MVGGFLEHVAAVAPGVAQFDPDPAPGLPDWYLPLVAALTALTPVILILQCCGGYYYYAYKVKPTEQHEMGENSVVPQEMKGRWPVGLFSCFEDTNTCCWGCFCSTWMLSETWFRAGHAEGIFKSKGAVGCVYSALLNAVGAGFLSVISTGCGGVLSLVMSMIWALFRGGLVRERIVGVTPIAVRLGIDESPIVSIGAWCCCPCCAICQENRSIKLVLEHPGFVKDAGSPQAQAGFMAGAPQMQGMQPMGQPPMTPGMQQPMMPGMQQPMGMQPMGQPPMMPGMQQPMMPGMQQPMGGFEMNASAPPPMQQAGYGMQ